MRLWLTLCALCCAALGCAQRPRTQVMVVIDAEPMVRASREDLVITVTGGTATLGPAGREVLTAPVRYPVAVAIVPLANEPNRRFHIEVRVAGSTRGSVIASASRTSGWIPGRTLRLDLLLEDCCIQADPVGAEACEEGLTCIACRCQGDVVDPNQFDDLDPLWRTDAFTAPDGGIDAPQGGDVGTDAFVIEFPDSGNDGGRDVGLDAPSDGGNHVDAGSDAGCGGLNASCCAGGRCSHPGLACSVARRCRDRCVGATCEDCTSLSGCAFCLTTGRCGAADASGFLDGTSCGPIVTSTSGMCPADPCPGSDCATCLGNPGCGLCFNGGSASCDPGTVGGPTSTSCEVWTGPGSNCARLRCSVHASCGDCAATSGCGWCRGSMACLDGTTVGPTDGSCVLPDWVWTPAGC